MNRIYPSRYGTVSTMHFFLTPNISVFFVWSIFNTKRFKTGSVRDSVCSANFFVLYSFFYSMGGLCDEGYESLGQATLHVWDVEVTQHSKWAAKRVRRGLFWAIDCRSPQVVGPVVQ